jgi:hypothetical protein
MKPAEWALVVFLFLFLLALSACASDLERVNEPIYECLPCGHDQRDRCIKVCDEARSIEEL